MVFVLFTTCVAIALSCEPVNALYVIDGLPFELHIILRFDIFIVIMRSDKKTIYVHEVKLKIGHLNKYSR